MTSVVSKLYLWRDRGLFLGTKHVAARDFTTGSDQLLVCLDGEITRHFENGQSVTFKSVLLRAGIDIPMKSVESTNSIIAICHLNSIGQDYFAVKDQMQLEIEKNFFHHKDEDKIIEKLTYIQENRFNSRETYQMLDDIILPGPLKNKVYFNFDPRVVKVLKHIEDTVRENVSVEELAETVHLSESRLVKLFKSQIGIPITRYRIRRRVHVGMVYLCLGYSVTEAALGAGFASTAHFSKCFSAILGIPPSSSVVNPPFLDVILDEVILSEIRKRMEEQLYYKELIGHDED